MFYWSLKNSETVYHYISYVVVQFYPWFELFFLCIKLIIIHYHTQKQLRKLKFKPRIIQPQHIHRRCVYHYKVNMHAEVKL